MEERSRAAVPDVLGIRAGLSLLWLRIGSRRFARLLSYERHRVNNHIQVLSGWLALGRPEKANEYLERVIEDERLRSGALQALPSWAQLRLVELWALAERAEVTLRVEAQDLSPSPGARVFTLLERLIRTGGRRGTPLTIDVSLRGAGFRVRVAGDGVQDLVGQLGGGFEWRDGAAVLSRDWQEGAGHVR